MIEAIRQGDTSHTLEAVNQGEKAIKRDREEGNYIAETTTETRFKLRYNKKPKLNSVDKGKVTIEVEDTDVPKTNTDAAIVILNEPTTNILNE